METKNGLMAKAQIYEVLSHPLRLFVLERIKKKGEATWTELQKDLEDYAEKRLNPNSINFHLTRLIDAELVEKKEIAGEQKYILTEKARGMAI
jgi:DNA-binding transcriptional ArsR family regulator